MPELVENFWQVEGRIARLTELWADDSLSAAKIGGLMGCTKNAIVSAVHRYSLPARRVTVVKPVRHEALLDLTPNACRWPHGHPGEEQFHFCGKPVKPEKPYCPEHDAVAHIKERTPALQPRR